MLPTAHLAVTIILWSILDSYVGCDILSLFLAVLFGVFIDIDAIVLKSMHRQSILHSFLFWIIVLTVGYLVRIPYYWTPIFAMIHIALDSIDWGVYALYPISKKCFGLRMMAKKSSLLPGKNSIMDFVKEYFSCRPLVAFEIVSSIIAAIIFVYKFMI